MKKYSGLRKYLTFFSIALSNKINTKEGIRQIVFERETSYDEYKQIQTEGNKEKIEQVFETEDNIKMLSNFLEKNLKNIKFGICHGTRRGKEQEWFRKYLHADVIGTEISETATKFPYTIQWDFHNIKDEWKSSVDFIYSNSLDHSYDGTYCLKQWFSCLRKSGICIINGTTAHLPLFCTKLDPFGYTKEGLEKLISEISDECNVSIEVILDGKINQNKNNYRDWYYFIIRKN